MTTSEPGGLTSPSSPSPVRLRGHLEEPLSRGLWIVKVLLVLPHAFVLAVLWIGFFFATLAAGLSILFTGRYPESIFNYNLGVLRWTWRVGFYSYSALGTDRYPPFTLEPVEDFPAALDVQRPQALSRGMVLVKWLLALPHWLVLAILLGGGSRALDNGNRYPGLIAILAVIAGFAVLFTGRYPKGLFGLLMGLNRWVFRVIAYVALMTDTYPPFRLDQGEDEPER